MKIQNIYIKKQQHYFRLTPFTSICKCLNQNLCFKKNKNYVCGSKNYAASVSTR